MHVNNEADRPTLQALAARYAAAVRLVEHHDGAGLIPDADFDILVDEELVLARLIALTPAASLEDLAVKATVAVREFGLPGFKLGEPIDCNALLKRFADDPSDVGALIDASVILDVVRLAGKAVAS